MTYYTRQLLNSEELKPLTKDVECSNLWVDGNSSVSFGKIDKIEKKNTELSDGALVKKMFDLIMESLDNDRFFNDLVVPNFTHTNIISRYNVDDFYGLHLDGWANGDYSTTVFLSDPETYDGGELCLNLNANGTFEEFKLPFGWAVTYPTGTLHKVNKVTRGVRYASVFWTTSLVKNPLIREIIGDVGRALTLFGDTVEDTDKISEEHAQMITMMLGIKNKLIRSEYYYND